MDQNKIMMMLLGRSFKETREDQDLSRSYIKRQARLNDAQIKSIESGGDVNIGSLIRYAEVLGMEVQLVEKIKS